jgi:putative holliday junction resolvase
LDRSAEIIAEYEVMEVIVGLPTSLSGREGAAAQAARDFAVRLADRLPPEAVRMYDERLTTVTAESGLRERGVRGQARRQVVDQAAAVVLLQAALDGERLTERPPGEIVRGSV